MLCFVMFFFAHGQRFLPRIFRRRFFHDKESETNGHTIKGREGEKNAALFDERVFSPLSSNPSLLLFSPFPCVSIVLNPAAGLSRGFLLSVEYRSPVLDFVYPKVKNKTTCNVKSKEGSHESSPDF